MKKNKFQRGKQFTKIKTPLSWKLIDFCGRCEEVFENYYKIIWWFTNQIESWLLAREHKQRLKEIKQKEKFDAIIESLKNKNGEENADTKYEN